MATHMSSEQCPSCGGDMNVSIETKPFLRTFNECPHCGFTSYPEYGQMSLDELNDKRESYNEDCDYESDDKNYLKPLTELPKCVTEPDNWGDWESLEFVQGDWENRNEKD